MFFVDHPGLIHFSGENSAASNSTTLNNSTVSVQVNLNGEATGAYLGAIFEDNKINAYRQKVWEEQQELNEDRDEKMGVVKDVRGLTIGKLVNRGIHTLSRKEIRDYVRDYEAEKKSKKQKVEDRKMKAKKKIKKIH